jgi:hypothetical protein
VLLMRVVIAHSHGLKNYHGANVVSILQGKKAKADTPVDHLRNIIQEALQVEVVPRTAEEVAAKLTSELVATLGNDAITKIDPARVADRALTELRRYMNISPDQWPQNGLLQIATDVSKEFKPKMTPTDKANAIIPWIILIVCIVGIWWTPLGYLKFWPKILLSLGALFVAWLSSYLITLIGDTIAKRSTKK